MKEIYYDELDAKIDLPSKSVFKSEMTIDLPPNFSREHYIKWLSFGAHHILTKESYELNAKCNLDDYKENEKKATKKEIKVKATRVKIKAEFIDSFECLKSKHNITIRDTVIMVMMHIKNTPNVFFK